MERIDINTRCMCCKHFEEKATVKIPKSMQLLSYGICDIWCHHVVGSEFCSRGEYDEEWLNR